MLEEHLASDRMRVVAFTLASNALGTVTDARRIADLAHAAGALAWADGVHYAPHRRLDRDALGLDVLLCSPYKFFGPHLGVAAIRHDLARSWPADRVRPADEEPAGPPLRDGHAVARGAGGPDRRGRLPGDLGDDGAGPARAAERLDTAFARIAAYERALTVRTLERLPGMAGVRLHGIADPARADERTPTFCLTLDRHAPREAAEALGREGIFTWDGNYYALEAIRALGLERRAARCAPATSTTRRRTRSTASSTGWRPWRPSGVG